LNRKIGLLGGTFDPPHTAHLVMASTARDALTLDRVYLVPSARPPHKAPEAVSAFGHRAEMTRIAVRDVEGVEVSLIEAEREGPSWTVSLLSECRSRFGDDLYFIIGADSLQDLPTWREPQRVLQLCTLVVFARGRRSLRLPVTGEARVVVFELPQIDVSSTEIRNRLGHGGDPLPLVPEGVLSYARRHRLYGSGRGGGI